MGTFAEFWRCGNATKDERKMEEFSEKVKTVFQCGGMMDIESTSLFGKKIITIRKAEMDSDGMNFHYNYFEDDVWKNAGYDRKDNYVWSNKIGWSQFHDAVVAAYTLEEQYTEGVAATMVNGEFVSSWEYVGWLNYLFDERKHIKNFDTWSLFEAHYRKIGAEDYDRYEDAWSDFGDKRYAFISKCEIYAVLHGINEMLKMVDQREKDELENLSFEGMKFAINYLKTYEKSEECTVEEQCKKMMNAIKEYYLYDKKDENEYSKLIIGLSASDAPAVIVKGVAETFSKDFWELWDEIKDVVCRKQQILYGNAGYYVIPISTQELFRQNSDDMVLYWEDDGKITFSDELWNWFYELKIEFDNMVEEECIIKNPLRYMVELLEEAEENFYRVFAISNYFEECMENLNDVRYQTLWRLFDKLIHSQELREAADVIFVPEGPEHENEGVHYWGDKPKRRLIRSWDIMSHDKKQNIGRMTVRRFLALVANLPLRKKVFGF
ncbi:MAG: hypothetical protein J6C07_04745 [Lachnospiraceae bacterium]|nr:hypothetical protein [Lachnospiraceae bacterium]MBO5176747.1 hypothetical protein [Lachnospiraceae bacterium]